MPRYLAGFILVLVARTAWDWYEHVSRADSALEAHPVAWGVFSAASMGVVIGIIAGGDAMVRRARGWTGLSVHAGLVAAAFMLHVFLSGPILDRLDWPHGTIQFNPAAAFVTTAGAIIGLIGLRWIPGTEPVTGEDGGGR